jgi:hypothetical protein
MRRPQTRISQISCLQVTTLGNGDMRPNDSIGRVRAQIDVLVQETVSCVPRTHGCVRIYLAWNTATATGEDNSGCRSNTPWYVAFCSVINSRCGMTTAIPRPLALTSTRLLQLASARVKHRVHNRNNRNIGQPSRCRQVSVIHALIYGIISASKLIKFVTYRLYRKENVGPRTIIWRACEKF